MSFNGLPDNEVTGTVQNDGWWPDLELEHFQNRYRLPAEYAQDMITENIQLAMLWTNDQLKEWKDDHVTLNYESLADVPGDQLGTETRFQILYTRATFCHAKALLLKQFATVNRREAAKNEAKESEESEDKFMEFARAAISDFTGTPRIGVHDL